MNPVDEALSLGYKDEQILNFVAQKYPEVSEKISKAVKSGYSPNNILKFIIPFFSQSHLQKPIKATSQQGAHAERRKQDIEANKKLMRDAANVVATLGTGYTAGRALTNAAPKIASLFGGGANAPAAQQIAQSPIAQALGKNIEATSPATFTGVENLNLPEKLSSRINSLLERNAPEVIPALLAKTTNPKIRQEVERTTGLPFAEAVKKYATRTFQEKEKTNLSVPSLQRQAEQNLVAPSASKEQIREVPEIIPKEKPQEAKISPPKVGEYGSTESGEIGEIKGISGHSALIDINGKTKRVPLDQISGEPEEIRKAKIVFDPASVPEKMRSAALSFVIAPENKRDVIISFGPSGKFYRYYRKDGNPVDKEIIEKLKEGTEVPVTTGSTYMGSWDANEADSRGTVAFHDIVRKAQKEGEADDPSKEYYFEELEVPFMHGFINEFMKSLSSISKKYKKSMKK